MLKGVVGAVEPDRSETAKVEGDRGGSVWLLSKRSERLGRAFSAEARMGPVVEVAEEARVRE